MNGLLPAVATAVFVWWFSTGLVLILVRLSRRAIRLSVTLATLVGVAALYGLSHTARQTGLAGAYCAFTCALLAWAWHELTFLTGWITGPRRTALPAGLSGWPRFVQSVRAILWHELGILAVGLIIVAITWRQPNQVGTGTFLVLWVMRTSAKLNLFLGVRNLSEQFLPEHLGRQAEDVEIVVTPTHFGCHQVVAGGRADAMDLVGGDRHADAGAAEEDPAVDRSFTDAVGDVGGNIGIVDGVGPATAAVDDLMAHPFE